MVTDKNAVLLKLAIWLVVKAAICLVPSATSWRVSRLRRLTVLITATSATSKASIWDVCSAWNRLVPRAPTCTVVSAMICALLSAARLVVLSTANCPVLSKLTCVLLSAMAWSVVSAAMALVRS